MGLGDEAWTQLFWAQLGDFYSVSQAENNVGPWLYLVIDDDESSTVTWLTD